ncbi:MAG: helix-turn-helix domain-containing protein [Carnobacterium maltaromaticum]|nr:helix-turn-helix transcriptional regulator [Carnobacterium maltaromaticum]
MALVQKIKELCDEKNITFAELERSTGISNGQIRRWDTSSPKIENIQKVADFFDVTTDYLLGRNQAPKWATQEQVTSLEGMLERDRTMSYNGENLTEDEKETVRAVLEGIYWKKMAKKSNLKK